MRRTSVPLKVKEAQNYEAYVLLDLLLEARTFMNQKKLIFPRNYILRDIIQFEVTSAFFS